MLLLALHWPRTSRTGALLAMLSGLGTASYYIFVNHPVVQAQLGLDPQSTRCWGLEAHSAAVLGVPISLLAGVLGSLWGPSGQTQLNRL